MKKGLLFCTLMLFLAAQNVAQAQGETLCDVQNSGSLNRSDENGRMQASDENDGTRTIVLLKEGSILSGQLLNYESSCGTTDFNVTSTVTGGGDGTLDSIYINVDPIGDLDKAGVCTFNVSFTIRNWEASSFYLNCWWYEGLVELTDGEPLVLKHETEDVVIDGVSFRLMKVMHKAMLMDWRTGEGELHVPSVVSYEGEDYTVACIANAAFGEKLTKITLPKTIKSMGLDVSNAIYANPFSNCTSLEWIEVEEGCPLFSSVDGVLFTSDKKELMGYPIASSRESYTVPEGVTGIRSGAFSYTQHLKKLTIPDGVTFLGWGLFLENKSLEEVRLPQGLSELEQNMFRNCESLKSVEIPKGVTRVGDHAFEGCSSLTQVTIPQGVNYIGYSAFYKCTAIKTLDIPKSVSKIGGGAFGQCKMNTLYIRGVLESYYKNRDLLVGLDRGTKLYVPVSEADFYKSIFKGEVIPLEEEDVEYIEIDETNFPDANLRSWILSQEYGKDGVLTADEIAAVRSIYLFNMDIQNMRGIEYFTALTKLECYENPLTWLDISRNTALTELYCSGNQLTALDVSKNTALKALDCDYNQLTRLDLSKNTALESLSCNGNMLTELGLSKCTGLVSLECHENWLVKLVVQGCTKLTSMNCYDNLLAALDVSTNTSLTWLRCDQNLIKGAAMDALVQSLPTASDGILDVLYNDNEENVITKQQVAVAKVKGWTPRRYNWGWRAYAGSDEVPENVSFTQGQMATIILPTAPDADKGHYYRLDKCKDGQIIFEEELQPQARTPYIIVPTEDFSIEPGTLDLVNLNRDIVSIRGIDFIGGYIRQEFDYEDCYYVHIIDTTPDCWDEGLEARKSVVGALRAYLLVDWAKVGWDDPYNQGGTKGPWEKMKIVLHSSGTGINEIENGELKMESYIYDLQGRKLSNGQIKRGIYIKNGQKKVK